MPIAIEERLGTDIKRVEQVLMAAKQRALRELDLTVPQYAVLYGLAAAPGISAAALARDGLVTPQTVGAVLTNLEQRGLIERGPHPFYRNAREIRLTDKGHEALAAADERASAIEQRLLDAFDDRERDTLRALLRRCFDVLTAD